MARSTIGRLEPRATGHTPGRDAHLKRTSKPPFWVLKRSDGRRTMVEWTAKRLIRGRQSAVHCDLKTSRATVVLPVPGLPVKTRCLLTSGDFNPFALRSPSIRKSSAW